jgi:hypothetical protein
MVALKKAKMRNRHFPTVDRFFSGLINMSTEKRNRQWGKGGLSQKVSPFRCSTSRIWAFFSVVIDESTLKVLLKLSGLCRWR